MFFYVSLFVACVISVVLVLYLYHALLDAGRAIYKGMLPSSKDNATSHLGHVSRGSTASSTQTPWGWKADGRESRKNIPTTAAPNGTAGLDGFVSNAGNKSSSVGWPYREDKVELTGKAYKVKRKTTASKKSRSGTNSKQPWGW